MEQRFQSLKRELPESFDESSRLTEATPLVVRLDEPASQARIFGRVVDAAGWFLVSEELAGEGLRRRLRVRALLREGDTFGPLLSSVLFEGRSLALSVGGQDSDAEFRFASEPTPVCSPEVGRRSRSIRFRAQIPMPFGLDETRAASLLLVVEVDGAIGVSNETAVTFLSSAEQGLLRADFAIPQLDSSVACYTDLVALNGWALAGSDVLEGARVFLGAVEQQPVYTGVSSPNARTAFPDAPESSNCAFTAFLSHPGTSSPVDVRVELRFRSGAIERLEKSFDWLPHANQPFSDGACYGEIEYFGLTPFGSVELRGYFLPSAQAEPALSIGLFRGRELLASRLLDTEPAAAIRWSERPDITRRFPSATTSEPAGIAIELPPLLLREFPLWVPGTTLHVFSPGPECRILLTTQEQATGLRRFARVADRLHWEGAVLGAARQIRRGIEVAASKRRASGEGKRKRKAAPTGSAGRVAIVSHNLSAVEGAPVLMFAVVEGLIRGGADPKSFIVVSPYEGPLGARYEALGVEVLLAEGLGMFQMTWEWYHERTAEWTALFQDLDVRAVYANVVDSFWAVDVAARLGLPVAWCIHESKDPLFVFPELDPRLRQLFWQRLRDAELVFVSQATRAVFAPYTGGSKQRVIVNGIDPSVIDAFRAEHSRAAVRSELGIDEGLTVVSVIGTTTARKGQDVFLEGMALLKSRSPKRAFRFFVVGARKSDYLSGLERQAERLGLSELEFVAERPGIWPYYSASDVVVIASREEAAPLVTLEAFAFETPLATTAVYGLAEQTEHEVSALQFEVDDPDGLARAVERLLDDPALAGRVSRTARQLIENRFSLERCSREHAEVVALLQENSRIQCGNSLTQ